MDLYFVRSGAAIHGPYTPSVLRGLTARGRFAPDSQVSGDGLAWVPLTGNAVLVEPAPVPVSLPTPTGLPSAVNPVALAVSGTPPSQRALGWVLGDLGGWLRWLMLGAAIVVMITTFLPFGSLTISDRRTSETFIAFFWSDLGGKGTLLAIGSVLGFAAGVLALLTACMPRSGLGSRPACWTLGGVALGTALLLFMGCLITSSGGDTNSSLMGKRWGNLSFREAWTAMETTLNSEMVREEETKVAAGASALRMGVGSLSYSLGLPPGRISFAVIAGSVLLAVSSGFLATIARTDRNQLAWSVVALSCASTFVVGAIVSLASKGLSHASWITLATVGLVTAGAVIGAGVLTILSPSGRRPILRRIAWHLVVWSLVGVLACALLVVPLILLIGGEETSWAAFNGLTRTWQFTGLLIIAGLAVYGVFGPRPSTRPHLDI
jgi:hypothetical protein